jgi:hypothetical protein
MSPPLNDSLPGTVIVPSNAKRSQKNKWQKHQLGIKGRSFRQVTMGGFHPCKQEASTKVASVWRIISAAEKTKAQQLIKWEVASKRGACFSNNKNRDAKWDRGSDRISTAPGSYNSKVTVQQVEHIVFVQESCQQAADRSTT